jgi:hypothetical protein
MRAYEKDHSERITIALFAGGIGAVSEKAGVDSQRP